MADKLISELIEVINGVANNDEEAELDLKEFETALTALEVEFAAKDTKIKELEKEVKKLGKEVEALTESNEKNVETVEDILHENDDLRKVIVEDIRVKAEWLKNKEAIETLEKETDTAKLLALKVKIDEVYNDLYKLDPEIQIGLNEDDGVNDEDFQV